MSRRSLDDLGDLQKAVMEAVWGSGEATVQKVRDRLRRDPPPAYTTVLSVMQKLEKAGWLTHRAEGRTYVYRAVRSREEVGSSSLRSFLDRVFQGDALRLFQHLIDDQDLSDHELAALRKMIDARRKERRDG
jgi:BlaI family transcriptional regulator, penicillinase repressor